MYRVDNIPILSISLRNIRSLIILKPKTNKAIKFTYNNRSLIIRLKNIIIKCLLSIKIKWLKSIKIIHWINQLLKINNIEKILKLDDGNTLGLHNIETLDIKTRKIITLEIETLDIETLIIKTFHIKKTANK